MPVLEISFLAGRYHATAWGRNVNEGDPEWPPSPFRLARAFMDVRFRRHANIDDFRLKAALVLLTGTPRFSLPPVSRMAIKYYLDQGEKNGKKQAVLDAFVCMEKYATLYMELPQDAPTDALQVLGRLAASLSYLGRAESWVKCCLQPDLPKKWCWNCLPTVKRSDDDTPIEIQTLLSPEAYAAAMPTDAGERQEKRGHLLALTTDKWLEALSLTTDELRAEGWNRPPLLGRHTYVLIENENVPPRLAHPTSHSECCVVTYAIRSIPQPPVTHTLPLAELVHIGLMSQHKRCCDGDRSKVSRWFSGRDEHGNPLRGHKHAFYWPCDTNGDGRIDHVRILLHSKLTDEEMEALERLHRVWAQSREPAELFFLHRQPYESFPLCKTVVSATPVVLARHYKPSKGTFQEWLEMEVRRSCEEQHLKEPISIETLPNLRLRVGSPLPWNNFIRQRKDKPPRRGYGFRLRFETPVRVPFAIGSLAHFGLGLFVPEEK